MRVTPIRIEAIFLDMGGTLRLYACDDGSRGPALRRIMDLVGAEGTCAEFDAALSGRADAYGQWSRETRRELAEEELWTEWLLPDRPDAVVRPRALELNELWRRAQGTRIFRPDARDTIDELAHRGYRLGVISNTTSRVDAPRALEEAGIARSLQCVVLSAAFGRRKPDPTIFLEATRLVGVEPGRSAYLGDDPEHDVFGARQAGYVMAILIHDPGRPPRPADDPALRPDHAIERLSDLLPIFPPLRPSIARRKA